MATCEICGKRISKEQFTNSLRADGKPKNKGECDACAKELDELLAAALKPKGGESNE